MKGKKGGLPGSQSKECGSKQKGQQEGVGTRTFSKLFSAL